jgi:peptidoglycan hydrolase-like protein with peptidoglycan-binding domain
MREYAHQTYLGIEDFFFGAGSSAGTTTADVLPHAWAKNLSRGMSDDVDVLALQFALLSEGLYPPKGKTLRDCPLAGTFGSCTASALSAFQKANGIDGDGSSAGEKTLSILNSFFGE